MIVISHHYFLIMIVLEERTNLFFSDTPKWERVERKGAFVDVNE